MMLTEFSFFNDLPSDVRKIVILYSSGMPRTLSLVSKFFNEWVIPLKVTVIRFSHRMTNESLKKVQMSVTSIKLYRYQHINDEGLSLLAKFGALKSLDLYTNRVITDNCLKKLTSLTSLHLDLNTMITDEGITSLTRLTYLNLWANRNITNNGVSVLTNLKELDLHGNENITNEGIKNLTNLTDLNLRDNKKITNDGLKLLTNLTHLNLRNNKRISTLDLRLKCVEIML